METIVQTPARNDTEVTGMLPDGFSYHPTFLRPDEHDACLQHVSALPFVHDTGRYKVLLKRRYAQFGYSYVTVGRKLVDAAPFPAWLVALAANAARHCPEGTMFNQAIITHYPKTAGIGWHTDAKRFGACIAGITLAGTGRFQFRPNNAETVSHELIVTPGSLYVMTVPARHDFQHQLKPVKTDRYSITLRSVNAE